METTIKRGPKKIKLEGITTDSSMTCETPTPCFTITLDFNGKKISYPTANPYDLFTWVTETLKTKLVITIEKNIGNLVQRKQKQLFIKEYRMIKGNKLRSKIFIDRFLKELI